MKIRTAYCSACDRDVRVVAKGDVTGEPGSPDVSELVCLEYGETCTGAMCPLFEVPTEVMREKLEKLLENGRPEGRG